MKKNILFICCEMGKGGVSKSLASLLSSINYAKYNVDLFLFSKTGLFLEQIPKDVVVLDELPSPYSLLKELKFVSFAKWALAAFLCKRTNNLEKKWGLYWRLNRSRYPITPKKYDVAISYNDGVELYYLIDCVNSFVKIGFNHTQYTNKFTYKPKLDYPYYKQLDYLVTISNLCADALKTEFPDISSKVKVVENIVSKEQLLLMAGNRDPFSVDGINRENKLIICTVAGLYLRKGFDFSSAALKRLKDEGYLFKWYIIGAGPEQKEIEDLISESGIKDDTIFLYEQKNPYRYVRYADIFMLTSHAEGKSIAVEEAKLLERPILITNYSTARNQIENGKSGIIAEMNVESVTEELRKLFDNKDLRESLSEYLKNNCHSNKEENIEKLYSLFM